MKESLSRSNVSDGGAHHPPDRGRPSASRWANLFAANSSPISPSSSPSYLADGTPVVRAPPAILLNASAAWTGYIVCRFFGDPPSPAKIFSDLNQIWGKHGAITVRRFSEGTCLVFVPSASTRKWILDIGLWSSGTVSFLASEWSATQSLAAAKLISAPALLTIKGVPPQLWSQKGIEAIAGGVAELIPNARASLPISSLGTATIRATVPLGSSLSNTVVVEDSNGNSIRVQIDYGRLPSKCPICHQFGHQSHRCPSRRMQPPNSQDPPPLASPSKSAPSEDVSKHQIPSSDSTTPAAQPQLPLNPNGSTSSTPNPNPSTLPSLPLPLPPLEPIRHLNLTQNQNPSSPKALYSPKPNSSPPLNPNPQPTISNPSSQHNPSLMDVDLNSPTSVPTAATPPPQPVIISNPPASTESLSISVTDDPSNPITSPQPVSTSSPTASPTSTNIQLGEMDLDSQNQVNNGDLEIITLPNPVPEPSSPIASPIASPTDTHLGEMDLDSQNQVNNGGLDIITLPNPVSESSTFAFPPQRSHSLQLETNYQSPSLSQVESQPSKPLEQIHAQFEGKEDNKRKRRDKSSISSPLRCSSDTRRFKPKGIVEKRRRRVNRVCVTNDEEVQECIKEMKADKKESLLYEAITVSKVMKACESET